LIRIDQKVNKAIELLKRRQSIVFKNIKRLFKKENDYETVICFINKNGGCEKPRRLHDNVFFYIEGGHLLKVN